MAALLFMAVAGCERAGGAPESSPPGDVPGVRQPADESASDVATRLEHLRKRGRFAAFVDAALETPDGIENARLAILKADALLAIGQNEDAATAARDAAELARDERDRALGSAALHHWSAARLRQGSPLACGWFEAVSSPLAATDSTVQTLRFWAAALGERPAYSVRGDGEQAVAVEATESAPGTPSADPAAISARVNGVLLPVVFIDTGAQHVQLTLEAAQQADVAIGPAPIRLTGFVEHAARPGWIRTLKLGDLTVEDVPALIVDSGPLVTAGGQMALGTELLHHVRFTIDYPAGSVSAETTGGALPFDEDDAWQIPLWTFSQTCLAQGQLDDGALARVLIDTGNRRGTYVSSRWAQRHLDGYQRPAGPVIFKSKRHRPALDRMELGNQVLERRPVTDTLPVDLERLDAVDVLVGRDLLGAYRVTIDLGRRMLLLGKSSTSTAGAETSLPDSPPHEPSSEN